MKKGKHLKGYKPYMGKRRGWQVVAALLGLLIIAVMVIILSTKASAARWSWKQEKAHEIAEIAREMGLPEDDPIIKRAQEIWYEEKNNPKLTLLGEYKVTGYDPFCSHCCGKWAADGITASGAVAEIGVTCAMKDMPFGTKVYIEGLGYYTVQDRGVGKGVIDVACGSHAECYEVTGKYTVYLVEG